MLMYITPKSPKGPRGTLWSYLEYTNLIFTSSMSNFKFYKFTNLNLGFTKFTF
jgi:hypothetical protein